MCKSVVKILVVGDVGCGKSKFIEEFLHHYHASPFIQEETHKKYVCEGTDYVIYLHNINDISIAGESDFLADVDMIIFSHTSDDPKTFRSLQETWIPRLKEFKEYCLIMDNATEKQHTPVPKEQVDKLEELFGLVLGTAYSSGYKEVFSVLKTILAEKSTHNQCASDECIADTFSENQHNSNNCVTVELSPNECSTEELSRNECSTEELSPNECSTEELSPNECSTEELSPNECSTEELSPNKCSTAELSPKPYATVESIPSDCSTEELNPKDYSTVEFSRNKCSTAEINPDKCSPVEFSADECSPVEFSADECSPFEFSADECSPDHCFPVGPDVWSPVKSSPDAAFSSDNFSSDESFQDK